MGGLADHVGTLAPSGARVAQWKLTDWEHIKGDGRVTENCYGKFLPGPKRKVGQRSGDRRVMEARLQEALLYMRLTSLMQVKPGA